MGVSIGDRKRRAVAFLPTTSLATPAASVITPTGVSRSFNSVRIRHRTGKACVGSQLVVVESDRNYIS